VAKRTLLLAYATAAYATFVGAVAWSVAFLANLPAPTGIDDGGHASWPAAVAVDVTLLTIFAVHHSVMAREPVKRRLATVIPVEAERSTFVLVASLLLVLLLWQWRPVDGTVWTLDAGPARGLVWAVFGLGWVIAIGATFMIDHADLVGLRQAGGRGESDHPAPQFREPWLYARVRHPMMLGLLIAFWATPTMTAGHLLFAVAATAYIVVGTRFEERDLRRQLGVAYVEYAARVPALVPRPRRRAPTPRPQSTVPSSHPQWTHSET
jgi:protein-S-isoprenylcysteine O-methyltransferase Ste14